jgi:serine/threonine protein kinase
MPTDSLCKVGDFGLAVMQDKAGLLTRSLRGFGTRGYVSPEQQYGLKIDERSDQYSLAALGYELLTGRRPLGQFLSPSRLNPQLPRKLDPVILRGLAEEPRDRYPSVREILTALERWLDSSPRKGPDGRLVITGLLVLLLMAAGVAAIVRVGPGKAVPGVNEDRQVAPQPAPASRSPEFTRLNELRAYRIWAGGGGVLEVKRARRSRRRTGPRPRGRSMLRSTPGLTRSGRSKVVPRAWKERLSVPRTFAARRFNC